MRGLCRVLISLNANSASNLLLNVNVGLNPPLSLHRAKFKFMSMSLSFLIKISKLNFFFFPQDSVWFCMPTHTHIPRPSCYLVNHNNREDDISPFTKIKDCDIKKFSLFPLQRCWFEVSAGSFVINFTRSAKRGRRQENGAFRAEKVKSVTIKIFPSAKLSEA